MLRDVAAANRTGADFMKKNSGNVMQIGKNNAGSPYDDDLTPCGLCGRKYNEDAYTNTLPPCEKKNKEGKMKGKVNNQKPTSNALNSKPNFASKSKK